MQIVEQQGNWRQLGKRAHKTSRGPEEALLLLVITGGCRLGGDDLLGQQASEVGPALQDLRLQRSGRSREGAAHGLVKGIEGDGRVRLVAAAGENQEVAVSQVQSELLSETRLANAGLAG